MAADAGRHEEILAAMPALLSPGVAIQATAPTTRLTAAGAPATPVPAAPRLTAAAISNSSIRVTWNNVAHEQGYRIQRADRGTGVWNTVATVGANKTTWTATGLASGTAYTFRVAAFNASGSRMSSPASATTKGTAPPTSPVLTATAMSQSQILLTWDDVANEAGYRLYGCKATDLDWIQVARVDAGVTTYCAEDLLLDTTYRFKLVAFNAAGAVESGQVSATTLVPPPTPPTLSATAVSSSDISLAWNDVAYDAGYRVFQRSGIKGDWVQIASLSTNTTAYTATGLTRETAYTFKVAAFNGVGVGESGWATTTTLIPPPACVTLSAQAASSSTISLSWNDVPDEAGYLILQSAGDSWIAIAMLAADTTRFTVTDLAPQSAYSFRAIAFNVAGVGESNVASATTPRRLPGSPSVTATAVSSSSVSLAWTDVSDEDGYRIMQQSGGTWTPAATLSRDATSFTVSGLAANTTYSFSVVAFNDAGKVESNVVKTATVRGVPGMPSISVPAVSSNSVGLAWNDVANEDGYRVMQWSGAAWSPIATTGRGMTNFTVTGLAPRTTYSFKVVAFNDVGNAESDVANPSTLRPLPGTSSLTASAVSASSIDLFWTDVTEEDGYRIMQMAGSAWSQIATLGSNARNFAVSNLAASTTYTFKIIAFNEAGDIESNAVYSTTQAPDGPAFPATRTFNSTFGWGLVDASAAVAKLVGRDTAFPSVPDRGSDDWANDMINSPEVWAQGYTGRGVVVAVVDSGVDHSHPDLYANIWINQREIPKTLQSVLVDVDRDGMITFRDLNEAANLGFVNDVDRNGRIDATDLRSDRRWMDGQDDDGDGMADDLFGRDFVDNDADPADVIDLRVLADGRNGERRRGNSGHGTHVAGTIAAMNNGVGVTGVAYDAFIMPVRVMNARGFGNENAIASGIRFAVDSGADVINLSLGGAASSVISSAVLYAHNKGVAVVVAAGNEGAAVPSSPADLAGIRTNRGIISVGAVDLSRNLAWFSNRAGNDSAMEHIVAPGMSIYSTLPRLGIGQDAGNQNGYGAMSGTSMAAPHVAGVVALCRSAIKNPPTNLQRLTWRKIAVSYARQPGDSKGGQAAVALVKPVGIASGAIPVVRGDSMSRPALRSGTSAAGQRSEALRALTTAADREVDQLAGLRLIGKRVVGPSVVAAGLRTALQVGLPQLTMSSIRS